MAEMRDPSDFPKALYAAAPLQLSLYIVVGVIGFEYDGAEVKDMVISEIDPQRNSILFRIAACTLFLHLTVGYLVKITILARHIHNAVHSSSLDEQSYQGNGRAFQYECNMVNLCRTTRMVCHLVKPLICFLHYFQCNTIFC